MKKKKCDNYYVMDKCINSKSLDKFGHESIAKNIELLIENDKYEPPYNIALIGQWGLGKSSILEIIRKRYEDNSHYKFIEINAWKYEKESLKNECLKKIYEEVSEEKITYSQQLESVLSKIFTDDNNTNNKEPLLKNFCKFIKAYWWIFVISFFISFVWQLANYISNGNSIETLLKNSILFLTCKFICFYFKNIVFTLCVPLLMIFVQKSISKNNNLFPLQIKNDNDYESLLTSIIEEKAIKFIIIIDDIDRLSTKKIVEALDTLKILMELKKCIFIVPFDDTILKKVLNKNVINHIDSEEQTIKSEFILDKLFQFRFYVPPLIYSDMKDYTLNIIKNDASGLNKYLEINVIDEIVKKVFMYDGVHTPRQIKKIINSFSNNILLFNDRIENGKIDNALNDKNGKLMIAKISVLQSDFNDFYDELFDNPNLCEKLVASNNNKYENYNDIPFILKKYYSKNLKIKEEYNKLLNFLSRTAYIKSDDMAVYLRCNEDKLSNIYGSVFNRNLLSNMQSMNFTAMNNLLEDNAVENIDGLLIEYLEKGTSYDLPMIIASILNIKDLILENTQLCQNICSAIACVYESNEKFELVNINLLNLLNLKKQLNENISIIRLLDDYFSFLKENVDDGEINHKEIFELINKNFIIISDVQTNIVKEYLYELCEADNSYIELLNEFSIDNKNLKKYYGEKIYNLLIEKLDDSKEISYKIYCELIEKLYLSLKDNQNIEDINELLINLLEKNNYLELCDKIITKNIEKFNKNECNHIVENISKLDEVKLLNQYNIINCCKYDLTKNNSEYENKICMFIENSYDVSNILNAISNYEFIDLIINKINSKIYNNSKYDVIYKDNISKVTSAQKNRLIVEIASTIDENTYINGRLTCVINILGKEINIDKIVEKFTNDNMIKNIDCSNEIINLNNHNFNISNASINNYIKRLIELLPTLDQTINLLEKLKGNIELENLKLLVTVVSNDYIETLDINQLNCLFRVYKNFIIDETNKEYIKAGLNSLLYTSIYIKAIEYMILNNIEITDSFKFINDKINDINKLKKINNINSVLLVDENFTNRELEKIKNKEYSSEELVYLVTLDNDIKNNIFNYDYKYNNDEYILLINCQKLINELETEKILANFQQNIIINSNEELLISILNNFITLKNKENIKTIKNSLEIRFKQDDASDLLKEKINIFYDSRKYRRIKKEEKELVMS